MLKLFFYQQSAEIFDLEFLDKSKNITIVTPSPSHADIFRENILRKSENNTCDILTIANLINSKFISCFGEKSQEQVKSKSELLLTLSSVWKKIFPTEKFELFLRAFNLFTDFRSFTLNVSMWEEVLGEYDERLQKAVIYFGKICEALDIVDEQRQYVLLSEVYLQPTPELSDETFLFWGFKFLSAVQIELLKSMAKNNDIFVPFPQNIYNKTLSSDWVKWLTDDMPISSGPQQDRLTTCQIIPFPKNALSLSLGNYSLEETDVFLGVASSELLDLEQIREIPTSSHFFKTSNDIFPPCLIEIFSQLDIENNLPIEQLRKNIKNRCQVEKDFLNLKILTLFYKLLGRWQDLSAEHSSVNVFHIKVFKYILELDLPRTFSIPLLSQKTSGNINDLSKINSFNQDRKKILVITANYPPLRSNDSSYSERVLEFLQALGPIPRPELDYLLLKDKILELIASKNTTIFMENGLLESDVAWSGIFSDFKVEYINNPSPRASSKIIDDNLDSYINKKYSLATISASKLQTYIDCPRKFYFRYVEKLKSDLKIATILRPPQLGIIEHEVVGSYLSDSKIWQPDKHKQIVANSLNGFLQKEKVDLNELDRSIAWQEISDYTQNTILELFELKGEFEFEVSFPQKSILGSIDCLVQLDGGIAVIDFKRSKYSIPNKKSIFDLKKIQMPFYLSHLEGDLLNNIKFWGYIDMSDITQSSFFDNYDDTISLINSYKQFESDLINKIKSDDKFLATPAADTCEFCDYSNICCRGETL